jgi:hypothetical protein
VDLQAHRDLRALLVPRVIKDLRGIPDQPGHRVLRDRLEVPRELPGLPDQQAHKAHRDLQALPDILDLMVLLELKVQLVKLALQAQ